VEPEATIVTRRMMMKKAMDKESVANSNEMIDMLFSHIIIVTKMINKIKKSVLISI